MAQCLHKRWQKGFILDGFPRTVSQAKALDDYGIEIDTALSLEVDDDVIVKRLSGRRECSHCRTPYHVVTNPPAVEGICDKCSSPLIAREDDNVLGFITGHSYYKEVHISDLIVYEEFRKRKVGTNLVQEVIEEFKYKF